MKRIAFIFLILLLLCYNAYSKNVQYDSISAIKIDTLSKLEYLRVQDPRFSIYVFIDTLNNVTASIIRISEWEYKKRKDTIRRIYPINPQAADSILSLFKKLPNEKFKRIKGRFPDDYIESSVFNIKYFKENSDSIQQRIEYVGLDDYDEFEIDETMAHFRDSILKIVNIDSINNIFESEMPLKGCYPDFDNYFTICRISGGMDAGFHYVQNAPYGFRVSKFFVSTLKKAIGIGFILCYNTDFKNNSSLDFVLSKDFKVNLKDTVIKHFVLINYRYNNYDFWHKPVHNITARTNVKGFNLGVDIKMSQVNTVGLLLGYSNKIEKINTWITCNGYAYNTNVNYELIVSKKQRIKSINRSIRLSSGYKTIEKDGFFFGTLSIDI